jgi:hypothetical protein
MKRLTAGRLYARLPNGSKRLTAGRLTAGRLCARLPSGSIERRKGYFRRIRLFRW